nr:protein SMG9 isoform X1 [Loxodonta africana]
MRTEAASSTHAPLDAHARSLAPSPQRMRTAVRPRDQTSVWPRDTICSSPSFGPAFRGCHFREAGSGAPAASLLLLSPTLPAPQRRIPGRTSSSPLPPSTTRPSNHSTAALGDHVRVWAQSAWALRDRAAATMEGAWPWRPPESIWAWWSGEGLHCTVGEGETGWQRRDRSFGHAENPHHPLKTSSRAAVVGQAKLLPPERMKHSIKLVDDQMNWCDSAIEYLLDQTDVLVVGVLGLQGTGKSMVMSLLSANTPEEDQRAYVFRAQSAEMKERGGNQTSGIDFFITQERIVFLDTQPILSPSILDHLINNDRKLPPEYNLPHTYVEMQSLQIAAFLFTVCHVVIVVQDWFTDLSLYRFLQTAEMVKPSTPSPSHESSSSSGSDEGTEYYPHLVFLQNKARREDFCPRKLRQMHLMIDQLMAHSHLRYKGEGVQSPQTPRYRGEGAQPPPRHHVTGVRVPNPPRRHVTGVRVPNPPQMPRYRSEGAQPPQTLRYKGEDAQPPPTPHYRGEGAQAPPRHCVTGVSVPKHPPRHCVTGVRVPSPPDATL